MKSRPPVGSRVRLSRRQSLLAKWRGKAGVVVAHHHSDSIAIVVRLDPQRPSRTLYPAWLRKFDRRHGLTFERHKGDLVLDYHEVHLEAKA